MVIDSAKLTHPTNNQVGRAQGKGIFLFKKLSEINDWKKVGQIRSVVGNVSLQQW